MKKRTSGMGMGASTKTERKVHRRFFSGVAELSAGKPSINIIGQTAELSRFGCFVQTSVSVPAGTKVSVKITHRGTEFVTSGEVIYIRSKKGIGIKFATPESKDWALLQGWLKETMGLSAFDRTSQ